MLVVDDRINMLKLFAKILDECHAVTTAQDGTSALGLVLGDCPFDVVVSDIRMPGADGFDVLRTVKRHSPATEVILMTAYAAVPAAVEAIKEGAFDYLQKPFDPDDAARVVARALEHKRRHASAHRAASLATGRVLDLPFREAVSQARDRASREYLVALLDEFQGNVTHAADHAGVERESLHRLLRRHRVHSEDFKR